MITVIILSDISEKPLSKESGGVPIYIHVYCLHIRYKQFFFCLIEFKNFIFYDFSKISVIKCHFVKKINPLFLSV